MPAPEQPAPVPDKAAAQEEEESAATDTASAGRVGVTHRLPGSELGNDTWAAAVLDAFLGVQMPRRDRQTDQRVSPTIYNNFTTTQARRPTISVPSLAPHQPPAIRRLTNDYYQPRISHSAIYAYPLLRDISCSASRFDGKT